MVEESGLNTLGLGWRTWRMSLLTPGVFESRAQWEMLIFKNMHVTDKYFSEHVLLSPNGFILPSHWFPFNAEPQGSVFLERRRIWQNRKSSKGKEIKISFILAWRYVGRRHRRNKHQSYFYQLHGSNLKCDGWRAWGNPRTSGLDAIPKV